MNSSCIWMCWRALVDRNYIILSAYVMDWFIWNERFPSLKSVVTTPSLTCIYPDAQYVQFWDSPDWRSQWNSVTIKHTRHAIWYWRSFWVRLWGTFWYLRAADFDQFCCGICEHNVCLPDTPMLWACFQWLQNACVWPLLVCFSLGDWSRRRTNIRWSLHYLHDGSEGPAVNRAALKNHINVRNSERLSIHS